MKVPDGFEALFTREEVEEALKEALEITRAVEPIPALYAPVFNAALTMIGQMRPIMGAGRIAVPHMEFGGGKLQ